MGAGIQQPTVQQGSGGGALLDVVRVLYEPTRVFERVRERPSFLAPFIAICAVQIVVFVVNMPFLRAAMAAQFAARPAGGPDPSKFLWIGAVFVPVGIAIALLIGGFLLWVLVSLMGSEAKFGRLLSVAAYSAVPSVVLLVVVGTIVLHVQGVTQVTSPQDMQPALGLDLLAPGARGFVGAALKATNPFSIWGLVLTAIGVSTTHRLSKSTGYTVATIAFVIGVLIAGVFGSFGSRAG
jgi:membrane protein, antimicrobial resistance system